MPLCTIDVTIIGQEGYFTIADFLATGEDVTWVCRRISVIVIVFVFAIDLYFLASFRIARSIAIEREADSIEQCRLATACGAYNAKDGAVAECSFFEVNHFTTLTVE